MENNKTQISEKAKIQSDIAFRQSWQSMFIIAIPAFLALFVGKKLDAHFDTNKTITIILIFLALVLSWTIILIRYSKANKLFKNLDEKAKTEKQEKIIKEENK